MENFLTCLAVASHMKNTVIDETAGKFFEEISLNAIYKSLIANCSIADVRLLLDELPKILALNCPIVENIRIVCIRLIRELKNFYRSNVTQYNFLLWRKFFELNHLEQILQTFDFYAKK